MNAPLTKGWVKCPHGELAQLSYRLWIRTWTYRALVIAGLVAAAATVGSAVKLSANLSSQASQNGGSCSGAGCATPAPGGCAGTASPTDSTTAPTP